MTAVFQRNLKRALPLATSGQGAYVTDAEGKVYLDASGGAAVSCLGHSHPAVIAAVQEQVATLPYVHSSFFRNAPSESLAARLIAAAPPGFGAGRVLFLGSGSEAMEAALKLARQYHVERGEPARARLVSRAMSYHGNTLGALAVGGHMQRQAMYAPMLMDVSYIEACHAYRHRRPGESDEAYGRRAADLLEMELLRLGPETVAAFVAETVSGATLGCVPPMPGYFQRIREICDSHGVLFIADEVMCGIGRTGTLFAIEQEGVCPDIITVAKGLGAGYQPIAAVLVRESVVAAIEAGSGALANGHTYMSHPVACAASLAVLDAIEQDDLLARVRVQGEALRNALLARFGQHPNVGDIRGRGLFLALEFVGDRDSKAPFPPERRFAERLKGIAQDEGLICYPSSGGADGTAGDHVVLAPPYLIGPEHVAEIVERLDRAIGRTLAQDQPSFATRS